MALNYNRADVSCNRNPDFTYETITLADGSKIYALPVYPDGFDGPQDPSAIRYRQNTSVEITQKESCLSYEILNQEYIRTDSECVVTTQPNIKLGWNGDYNPVWWTAPPSPSTNVTPRTSRNQVKQTIYFPTDVDCNILTFDCYEEQPLYPTQFDEPTDYYDELYLNLETDSELELEMETTRALMKMEFNTEHNPYYD